MYLGLYQRLALFTKPKRLGKIVRDGAWLEVHREAGFTFHVFDNDHQPAHIHVRKNDGEICIDISDEKEAVLLCMKRKMSKKAINRALDIAEENIKGFRNQWEEYHGPID